MKLHIVGGFLGSGKTTAIIAAAKYLAAQSKKVGVITNDQGKHLVDTSMFRAQDLPAMQVSGGCFCCLFDDLNNRLHDLVEQYHPDVIFAESVGSCADVVATVVRPLLELEIGAVKPSSYTVFVDVRLLNRFLSGSEMPFSESVNYIFGKQIEEAGLLFINKTDLVSEEIIQEVFSNAAKKYPPKFLISASALNSENVNIWVDSIQNDTYPLPNHSLEIDYGRYAAGEGVFAWIDREYSFSGQPVDIRIFLRALFSRWREIIYQNKWTSGHIKVCISIGKETIEKVSLAQSGEVITKQTIKSICDLIEIKSGGGKLLLNLLVEGDLALIRKEMDFVFEQECEKHHVYFFLKQEFNRTPGYPKPTYRMVDSF